EAVLDYMRIINDPTPYDGGGEGYLQGGGNTDGSEYNTFDDSTGTENIGAESQQYDEPEEPKVKPAVTVPDTGKRNSNPGTTPAKEQPKAVLPPKEDPAKKKNEKKKDEKKEPNKGDDYR
ncbi:MAG: hypothetical protein JNM68_09220, partial [Dinghuibacter sp.]|nr:hypothetical protein [Dinghuibacter sp.]